MALQYINGVVGGSGVGYALAATDDLIVGPAALIFSNDNDGITSTGDTQKITVAGSVYSEFYDGIALGSSTANSLTVKISATGSIFAGDDGIVAYTSSLYVENHGTVNAAWGMYLAPNGSTATFNVYNTGVISASAIGVGISTLVAATTLKNTGTIIGGSFSFYGSEVADQVFNSGLMDGQVYLGGGDDLYSGAFGKVIGTIDGGFGADRFILGAGAEDVDGGADLDTLDFTRTAGVRVALDGSFANTGVAAGDSYIGIEILKGSLTGADAFTGDVGLNQFWGYGGADSLSGGAGGDQLIGGLGKDVLKGGSGNDRFYFHALADAGDLVTDFANLSGNNDAFYFKASGFTGLTAGALVATAFQLRADNLAQDANDRFIFRTTDKTLWLDSNGNAAGGLTMIADLQNSAPNLGAGDIWVF